MSITGVQGDVIAGGDIVGRDKITTTIITDEKAYDVAGLPNPYLGLRSFTYAERTRYAGRERAVEEAVAKLTVPGEQRALLFITGASGSGKSSFAQAGLVPALEAYYAQRGQLVRHAVFRPGAHPLAARDDALKQLSVGDDGRPSQTIPVLILDQFEELFSQSQPEERASLFAWLAELPPFATAPRHLIVTVRSDYLNELFEVKPLWEAAKAGVELRAMQADELKDAILRPVQSRYPSGEKRLEPALVDRLAQDAAGQATYLPLVQVTLEELWRKGRLALSYYGTLSDAIKQRADQVFQFVDYDGAAPHQPRAEADQAAVLELFLSLVSVSPDDDPRRDVRLSRVTSAFTPEQRRLTADLSQARLLSVEDEPNGETVNIIHETLIRNWDRLRDGVNVRRQHLRQRGRFEQQLQLWLADDRSDDYLLLTNVQLAEARELDQAGDIALRNQNAQELLRRSIEHAEAERQRELEEAQKLAESERKRAEEQAQANRRMQARNRVITLVSVIALVAAISAGLFGIAAGFFGIQANRNAATAEAANAAALAQQTTAEANATEAFQQAQLARAGRLAAESVARLDNQLDLALLLGLEALRRQATVETRGTLLAGNTHRPQLITFLHGQGGQGIRSVAFGSNGQTLASSDLSGRVMLWHVPTRQSLGTFADESGTLFKIAFTPDGRRLVTAGVMGLAVWDVPTRQKVVSLAQDAESHFALSPDGKRLAWSACTRQEGTFSCGEQAVYISDLEANRILTSTSVVSDRVDSLAFSPDGRILAAIILPRSGTIVRTLFLWEAATLQPRDPLPGSEGVVARDIAFSPDGEWLIAAETQGVRLWNMRTRQPMAASQFFSQDSATRVAISPDGAWLAVGYADGKVVLASLPDVEAGVSRQAPVELFGHTQFVNSLAFSPDSALLASGAEDSQILLWDLTSQQALGQPLARQRNFSGLGEALAYSADGQTMALGGRGIELWNTATRQRVYQSVQDAGTLFETDTAVSPDGKILAAGLCESEEESQCANGEIRLLDVASGELRGPPLTGFAGAADGLLFSPDGKILASSHCAQAGGPTGRECALSEVRLWRVQTLDSAGPPLSLGAGRVTGLAFNREGDVLAVAGCPPGALNTADSENCSGGGIRLWNLNTREPLGGWLTDFPSQVDQLAFSPDGAALAASSCGHATIDAAGQPVACHSGIVRLWDVGDRQPLGSPLVDEAGPVTSLAFGPTGDVLATGGCAQFVVSEQLPDGDCVAGAVQLWDIQASKPIGARWVEPVGFITALAFSPDGQRLAAAGCGQKTTDTVRGQSWCEQAEISIWETQRGELVREPLKPEGASNLYRLAYSADGAHLQALYTSTLFTWETQTWQPIDQASVNLFVRSEADTVSSLAFSPKGNMLATGGCLTAAFPCLEGSIQLWDITDLQSPRLIGQPFGQHTNYVSSLAFSSDGQYLASGGWDEIVKVWDISDPAAPALVGQPLAGSGSVNSLVFSPDNKALVVANGEIQVWDPNTGKRLGQRLEAFHLSALSHDGRRLATASSDPNLIVLWDFSNPSAPVELGRLTGHTDTIRSLAFSPDGALLVTASEDKTIRLWDLTTFQALGPALTISRESVQAVAFSPDGALMVSAGESVRLWDLRLSAWRERACRIANRNLTQSEWRQFIGTEPYQKTCSDFPDGE